MRTKLQKFYVFSYFPKYSILVAVVSWLVHKLQLWSLYKVIKGYPNVCFKYRTDQDEYMVVELLTEYIRLCFLKIDNLQIFANYNQHYSDNILSWKGFSTWFAWILLMGYIFERKYTNISWSFKEICPVAPLHGKFCSLREAKMLWNMNVNHIYGTDIFYASVGLG